MPSEIPIEPRFIFTIPDNAYDPPGEPWRIMWAGECNDGRRFHIKIEAPIFVLPEILQALQRDAEHAVRTKIAQIETARGGA